MNYLISKVFNTSEDTIAFEIKALTLGGRFSMNLGSYSLFAN